MRRVHKPNYRKWLEAQASGQVDNTGVSNWRFVDSDRAYEIVAALMIITEEALDKI